MLVIVFNHPLCPLCSTNMVKLKQHSSDPFKTFYIRPFILSNKMTGGELSRTCRQSDLELAAVAGSMWLPWQPLQRLAHWRRGRVRLWLAAHSATSDWMSVWTQRHLWSLPERPDDRKGTGASRSIIHDANKGRDKALQYHSQTLKLIFYYLLKIWDIWTTKLCNNNVQLARGWKSKQFGLNKWIWFQ